MASRTKWTIYINTSGGSWTEDGYIYAPNQSLSLGTQSTKSQSQTADGDIVYTTPSNKYNYQDLSFTWIADDGTIKSKIEGYVKNQDKVKIVDDNGNTYVGYFVNVSGDWLVGVNGDEYDVTATFENISRS